MNLNEFKAWFEGFAEGIGEAPTPEQWAKIKAKIAALQAAIETPIIFDRSKTWQQPTTVGEPWRPYWIDPSEFSPGTVICQVES